LGGNQRPVILRLRNGRLFFASDFQFFLAQKQLVTNKPGEGWAKKDQTPTTIKERGSFVALSDGEGETWHIKKLELALPHESRQIPNIKRPGPASDHDHSTIGFAAAAYAPNGVIHLMTSMNHPSQHFEMNEAWILSKQKGEANHQRGGSTAEPQKHEEKYPDGKIRATWSSRIGANGDYTLHGTETWHYPDGKKKYEVTYQDGIKRGKETFWLPSGAVKWSWDHRSDGTAVWTQCWPSGQKKIESNWHGYKADGVAREWDHKGNVKQTVTFKDGAVVGS
jgi:antitoxin component YwqK of YwqJK toxin-antitoxin module